MPYTRRSKSIGTLMAEKAKDGIEPTRVEVFILTHRKRKDGRPLDEKSTKIMDMMQVKLNEGETSNKQPTGSVAWERDVYSQIWGGERGGYIYGLGLSPTPSQLWGIKSFVENNLASNISNKAVQRLEQKVRKLRTSKEKHDEEMDLMKQNQEKLVLELSFMRKVLYKHFPTKLPIAQNFNESSFRQVPITNSGYEQAHQDDENTIALHDNMFKPSGPMKPKIEYDKINGIMKDFDEPNILLLLASTLGHQIHGNPGRVKSRHPWEEGGECSSLMGNY
ncbi:transposase, Ptta/En/Spm, plant [Spatholobus suberectus]|nr:transposase, Ptta/En/Spm, plant [Spatholobus suberectus]